MALISPEQMEKSVFTNYVNDLTRVMLHEEVRDVVLGAWCLWKKLTGKSLEISASYRGYHISLRMDTKMANGEYPDKGYHVGQILEHIRDNLGSLLKSEHDSEDSVSHDFSFTTLGMFPDISMWIYYGGTCQRVQVGTELVEQPIFITRCG